MKYSVKFIYKLILTDEEQILANLRRNYRSTDDCYHYTHEKNPVHDGY